MYHNAGLLILQQERKLIFYERCLPEGLFDPVQLRIRLYRRLQGSYNRCRLSNDNEQRHLRRIRVE